MSWSASVVAAATSDTEPTIILTFDHAKYLFNVGENTNRAFLQSKFRWSRTRAVFLTQANIQRASGLGGTLMTFADSATSKKVDVVGPPGTLHYLATMRTYTFRADMAVNVREAPLEASEDLPPTPIYKSDHIHVYAIPLVFSQDIAKSEQGDPSSFSESTAGSPPMSLKRKRESSPNRPEKRPSTSMPSGEKHWSLEELRRNPDFSPSLLEGGAAQEWRKLIVTTMFPAANQPKPGSKEKSPKIKKKASTETDEVIHDDYRGSRKKLPGGFFQQLPKYKPQNRETFSPSLAYVVVGPRTRGKFDVAKADALGVLKWQRGKLTKGESVTVSTKVDGETITKIINPEDCIGSSEIPSLVMIFDVPTPFHIASLVDSFERSPFYRKFRSNHPDDLAEASVRTVFHICGEGVLEDERYRAFMQGFSSQTEHIISSREHSPDPVNFTNAAFNHLRLNQLDSAMFPIPKHMLTAKKCLKDVPNLPEKVMVMEANIVVSMRPPCPAVLDNDPTRDRFHPAIRSPGPCELSPATLQRFDEARRRVEMCIAAGSIPKPPGGNVGILPLGTGSALPSKYRNVSSTLIQIPGWGNILLDAGEGTWGQLTRHFGSEASISPNVWDALKDLKCIFISHIHGDHHMGVAKILRMRQQLVPPPTKPLYLVANRSVHLYLREVSDIENLGINDASGNGVIPVMSEALHWRRSGTYVPTGMWAVGGDDPWTDIQLSQTHATTMCRLLGFKTFVTIDVYHKTKCYGVYFKHSDGWSIVFSGDTMPTDTLVYVAKNATVLIHEATMGDDQEEMAKRKGHSTIGQALEVGKKMKAENILLTHFSARYPKMPPQTFTTSSTDLKKESENRKPIVALGFDHVDMTIGTLWKVSQYLPAIEQSFLDTAEEGDEEDEKEALRAAEVAIDVA